MTEARYGPKPEGAAGGGKSRAELVMTRRDGASRTVGEAKITRGGLTPGRRA